MLCIVLKSLFLGAFFMLIACRGLRYGESAIVCIALQMISFFKERVYMKRLALLLLFVQVVSQAAIKVEARARCGEDVTEQTFELSSEKNSFSMENECGTKTTVTLQRESVGGAEFTVRVNKEQTRDKDMVESEEVVVKAAYGEPVKFHCESCIIDADLEMVISPLEGIQAE
jgi:hypothetical protein